MRTTIGLTVLLALGCGTAAEPAAPPTAPPATTLAAPPPISAPPTSVTAVAAGGPATDGGTEICAIDPSPLAVPDGSDAAFEASEGERAVLRLARRVDGVTIALRCERDFDLGLEAIDDAVTYRAGTLGTTAIWVVSQSGESTVEGETDDIGILWIFEAGTMRFLGRVTSGTPEWTSTDGVLTSGDVRRALQNGALVEPS